MQTFYAIVNKSSGYEFSDRPLTDGTPSTYVVNEEAGIHVYWQGRTTAEMTNADALVIPVHDMLMDIAIGRTKGQVS